VLLQSDLISVHHLDEHPYDIVLTHLPTMCLTIDQPSLPLHHLAPWVQPLQHPQDLGGVDHQVLSTVLVNQILLAPADDHYLRPAPLPPLPIMHLLTPLDLLIGLSLTPSRLAGQRVQALQAGYSGGRSRE
jgi:hypothetical protein